MKIKLLSLVFILFALSNCSKEDTDPPIDPPVDTGSINLITKLRKDLRLEDKYTCNGENVSPEIAWNDSYSTTAGYTIIVSNGLTGEDREVYWLLSDIPATANKVNVGEMIPNAVSSLNSSGGSAYSGPCPEIGSGTHEFKIQFFALNKTLGTSSSSTESEIIAAMDGSILEEKTFANYYSTFRASSDNFEFGKSIPITHTCDGNHEIPQLKWQDGVQGATSYALHMFDTKAGNFIHWIITNIGVDEVVQATNPSDAINGLNNRNEVGYFGPCPGANAGSHLYYFRIYALDQKLDLESGFTLDEMEEAMKDHVLDQTDFYGIYPE